jgi:hypothetical protein
VSRLWPERRALALFPDRAWLYAGKQMLQDSSHGDMRSKAEALLQRVSATAWLRPQLDVLLSDEVARAMVLPWQDGLRTRAQLQLYAQACLEDVGVHEERWTMQYGYRHHGRAGIAYAVRTESLELLSDLATAYRLCLRSVLPVSAAAYWRQPLRGRAAALLVLSEARRVTALRFSGAGLMELDVQPVMESREMALRRFLRRAQAQEQGIEVIYCWSAEAAIALEKPVAECYPDAHVRVLAHGSLG